MSLGLGIAVAGIWIGAGVMTFALSFGNAFTMIDPGNVGMTLAAPSGAAMMATIFIALFSTS